MLSVVLQVTASDHPCGFYNIFSVLMVEETLQSQEISRHVHVTIWLPQFTTFLVNEVCPIYKSIGNLIRYLVLCFREQHR